MTLTNMKTETDLKYDKTNTNWNKEVSIKRIFEQDFNIGHFVLNNKHPLLDSLKPLLFATYKMIVKFTDEGYNNQAIDLGRPLAWRKNKFSAVQFNVDVKLIEGTPTKTGGSNSYPRVCFEEGYCVLEFISYGIPRSVYTSGWKTEILLMETMSIN